MRSTFWITTTIMTVIAIGLTPTAATAAKRPFVAAVAAKVAPKFQALDTNSNRSLDAAEWAATGAPANSFDGIDLNNNGNIGFFELVKITVAKIVAKRR
jgi:hypothetical protein